MAEIVNLNRFRKGKRREEAKERAAANRVLHGRTKAEREQEAAERRRSADELSGKRLDPEPPGKPRP